MQKIKQRFSLKLGSCLVAAALLFLGPLSFPASSQKPSASKEDLTRLIAGNRRFMQGRRRRVNYERERAALIYEQHPYATVLSCSDSRVPPEIVFDESLGKLFVIRVAGNVVDLVALGSIEYAAEHLHSKLLLVLGHESCGAVKAAVDGGHYSPGIEAIVEKIKPAVEIAKRKHPDAIDILPYAVVENIELQTKSVLAQSEIISRLVENRELKIASGEYWLRSGRVDIFPGIGEGSRK
ncbi:MAG: carbonic anhydrase [Acidobacteriota bacterium]